MGFRLKLLGFVVSLVLTLSCSSQAKNVAVNIIGSIHCTECIKHEFSNSQASLGVDVVIHCKSKNREAKTEGNGAIDKQGKFNVTLSSEIKEDVYCFAKLQTASSSGAPCPIQSAQTASVKLINSEQNKTLNKPSIIKFSPLTCQSAFFFCPHPKSNLTFFNSPPAPNHPVDYPLPPLGQPPLPPPAPASEPPYSPQAPPLPPPPEIEAPSPLPDLYFATPTPSPVQSPQYPPSPTIENPSPPTLPPLPPPKKRTPILPPTLPPLPPIHPPIPTKKPKFKIPVAPPPEHESPIGKSKPHTPFIPRAPPVPQLPPIPTVPRKYFSAPKSKPGPPRSI